MHHIYTTKAFVVHSSPYGESGKFILSFTKDFGMIGVVAQGIRLNQSKLRYHIQDSCFSNISIVRGKEVWRLTGAHEISYEKNIEIYFKILKLLRRLLHGEEKNERLFDIVEELYISKIEKDDFDIVELLTVFRILNTLGYIREYENIRGFLSSNLINREIIDQFRLVKSKVLQDVNSALKESQL